MPYARFLAARRRYRLLDEVELRARRTSDTVFVFGSGASLNELSPEEWRHFEEHQTFGFNWFVHQRFVRCDFHLVRAIPDTDTVRAIWEPQVREYFTLVRDNELFRDTVFFVQTGFRATNGNRALGYRLLPERNPVFLWRTNTERVDPGWSFADGLTHGVSTLQETVNAAFLAGWTRIVLVGVDLYDRRYFWLPSEQARTVDDARDAAATDLHSARGVIERLGAWRKQFDRHGVELSTYRRSSLLSEALPVYREAT